jgi:hypothetical protein
MAANSNTTYPVLPIERQARSPRIKREISSRLYDEYFWSGLKIKLHLSKNPSGILSRQLKKSIQLASPGRYIWSSCNLILWIEKKNFHPGFCQHDHEADEFIESALRSAL